MKTLTTIATALAVCACTLTVSAQQDAAALAKAAQNPVANMISLPFQNNTSFGATEHDVANTLNIQPVWPLTLNEDWNVITRTILPVVYKSALVGSSEVPGAEDTVMEKSGLGDTTFTAFLSPSKSGDVTWGVGPVALIPTSTDRALGAGEWGAGAGAVALVMPGKWVMGGIVQNLWSFEGTVNSFLVQPFINRNLENGWYLTTSSIITANWKADSDNRWTVPLGAGIGKIMTWGTQPVNMQVHGYSNVEAPEGAADWSLRVQLQFMFPRN